MNATMVANARRAGRVTGVARQFAVTRRLVRLLPVAATSVVAALVVWRLEMSDDMAEVLLAASFGVGIAPTLADPAAVTLGPSPTSRLWRVVARLLWVLPAAVGCWLVARVVAMRAIDGSAPLTDFALWVPGWEPVLVVATYGLAALAVELGTGASADVPGLRGSVFVLLATSLVLFLPPPLTLLPVESFRWRWIAVAGAAALVLACALADRGRRRVRPGRRRAPAA